MNKTAYLQAMGIMAWRQRLPETQPEPQLQSYLLKNNSGIMGAIIFVMASDTPTDLLTAILTATQCEYFLLAELAELQQVERLLILGDWQLNNEIAASAEIFQTFSLTEIIKDPLRKREVWKIMQKFLKR